jgi:RNA polymerase sigma-70 factor (ECF subfamily)
VYRRRLFEFRRVATAIAGSRDAGCDAVQDAFARAVHRREQFRGEGSLDAWLWRIVVREARDLSARRVDSPFDDEIGVEPAGAGELGALVGELPERQRLVLFLRYYADLDYAVIADALEISGGTVGATLNQARESLRRLMSKVAS